MSIRKDIDSKTFTFPKTMPLSLKLKDMLEESVDEKYYLSDSMISSIINWKAQQKPFERVLGNNSISPTLTARGAGETHSGMVLYDENLDETTNLQEVIKGSSYLRNFGSKGKIQDLEDICDTLIAGMGNGGGNIPIIETSKLRIRKLTPLECYRLMGFEDEDYYRAANVNSNTQLYKQAGNSIVVNVVKQILNELFKVLDSKINRLQKEIYALLLLNEQLTTNIVAS